MTTADKCEYGLKTKSSDGSTGPAKKPTRFLTNSTEIARELMRRCRGGHEHIPLVGGRAAAAAIYPRELCEAVCRGLSRQKKLDEDGLAAVGELRAVSPAEAQRAK